MKVSIAMIVKNEEKYLENTLKQLKEFQGYIDSEIIIVDTGSTDNTVKIAKRYTDRVFFHKWNNNFGDMRNISISYCSGEWVMIVDADEVLYDIEALVNLFKDSNDILKNYDCIMVNIVDFQGSLEKSLEYGGVSRVARIFKRKDIKFTGRIHEQPVFVGNVFLSETRFIHYGYDNNDYKLMEYKFNRNLNLLLENLREKPEDIYILYQIASAYSMHKDKQQALKYIKKAYEKGKSKNDQREYVLHKYCEILYEVQQYTLLETIAKEAMEKHSSLDYYFFAAEAFSKSNNDEKAIEMYNKYIEQYVNMELDTNDFAVTSNVITKNAWNLVNYRLAIYYHMKGLNLEALETLIKIKDESFSKKDILLWFKIIVVGKLWDRTYLLNKLVDNEKYEEILYYTHDSLSLEEIKDIDENYLEGDIKEIIETVKYFKINGNINDEISNKLKNIINEKRIPYLIYVYYILQNNIYDIKFFVKYGKDKLQAILEALISRYYDINHILMSFIKESKALDFWGLYIDSVVCRAMLSVGNISLEEKRELFINYLASKYYVIVKSYNQDIIYNKRDILSNEEKIVLTIKEILEKRYEDLYNYVADMKEFIKTESAFANYISVFLSNLDMDVSKDVKSLVPELVKNIKALISSKEFQQAYNTIEESLALVKFDYDIMILKLELLINFNFIEDAKACLREIILYGPIEKVNSLILNI